MSIAEESLAEPRRPLGDRDRSSGPDASSPARSEERHSERSRSKSSHHRKSSVDSDHRRSRDGERRSSRERRRSERSRERDRDGHRGSRRDRDRRDRDKDRDSYRARSRSPGYDDRERRNRRSEGDSYYRDDRDDRNYRSSDRGGRANTPRSGERAPREVEREKSPKLTEEEHDQRTIFVQQLAARLRTKELIAFFEKVGPVRDAQIVKDRVSGRSKGVGYVEFRNVDSVQQAIALTGQRLLDIPIIVQLTEAEKNRLARAESSALAQVALEHQRRENGGGGGSSGNGSNGYSHSSSSSSGGPYHRLYVGNVHFAITESDLKQIFQSYGEVEFVVLQKDETGVRSKGYGFVQFADKESAQNALELNGFKLGGRPIRVGVGNDKINTEPPESIIHRLSGGAIEPSQPMHGPTLETRGQGVTRARDDKKPTGALASALDDSDVSGISYNSVSRESLMKKLMRQEDDIPTSDTPAPRKPLMNVSQASRCVMLSNMFDPDKEEGENWVKELEDDVKAECEEKYGKVVHIAVDPNSKGEIYVKFENVTGGERAIQGLNGRFFGGNQISASPVVDRVYSLRFPRSKAL